MKPFLYKVIGLVVCIQLLLCYEIFATHSVGADISYTCLGGNTYRITLNFYRDCAGISAPSSATVNISSASCGRSFTLRLNKKSQMQVPALCQLQLGNTTCNGGRLPGIEQHVYEGVVNLPANCTDWRIGYDLCCRNDAITNLVSPGTYDMYVEARLNNSTVSCNDSPIFTTLPVPYVCGDQPIFYNHGAVDPDGDQLVYTLVNPLDGPSINIPYRGGFSVGRPMSLNGNFTLNPNTGQLEFNPRPNQNVVVTILVEEYRNGQLIGSTMRDIQIVVLPCPNNTAPAITGIDGSNIFEVDLCAGSNICFDIISSDPNTSQNLTMSWNNGIPAGTFTIGNQNRPIGTFCWTPTAQDIGANRFTVTIQDDACPLFASEIRAYTINVTGGSFTSTTTVTDLICNGEPTGAISLSVSGATPPVTYLWDNGATTPSVSGLLAGPHTVTITSGNGCSEVKTINIDQPPAIDINFTTTPAQCNGADNGTAMATISGGTSANGVYQMLWDVPPPNTGNSIANLASGWYKFAVRDDNQCVVVDSVFVFQPGPLIIQANASSTSNYNGAEISCYGASDGEITVTATGGTLPYSYTWSANANGQTSAVITGLDVGVYSVTLFDANGCNVGVSDTITEPDSIDIIDIFQTQLIDCSGGANGALEVVTTGGTPGYSYNWSANANGQTVVDPSNLGPGTYYVTVADLNGCSADTSISIIEPDPLAGTLSIFSDFNGFAISCNQGNDGSLLMDVTGGTPPYGFQWTAPGQTNPFAPGLTAGTYTVTVTDSNGCIITATETLNEPPPVSISTTITSNYNGFDVSCYGAFDGTAEATPAGGVPPYSYDWNDPKNQSTAIATDLGANITYVITAADLNECPMVDSVVLNQPDSISATIDVTSDHNGEDISCFGLSDGSAIIEPLGGTGNYTYAWDAAANYQTVDEAINLGAGTYSVVVMDDNGCTFTSDIELTEPTAIAPTTTITSDYNGQDISCFGLSDGSASVVANGGTGPYEYFWETNTSGVSNADADNLSAGVYSVTAVDLNGCEDFVTATLTEPLPIDLVTAGFDLECFEDNSGEVTVAVNGGTPDFDYTWNSSPLQYTQTASGLPIGTYTVTVTDVNNCQGVDSVSINQPLLLVASGSTVDASCHDAADGSATITPDGGTVPYDFTWSNGLQGPLSPNSTDLPRGTYDVTVTDANGCTYTETLEVGAPPEPQIAITAEPDTIDFGKETELTVDLLSDGGAPGGFYEWELDETLDCIDCEDNVAAPIYNTTYTVTYTNADGCTTQKSIKIFVDLTRTFYVPNAFSPNGDDVNDIFEFYALGVRKSNMKIFDRWGEKVYESPDMTIGWDGIFRDQISRPGVYVYYIDVEYLDGFTQQKAGSVTLIR